MLIKTNAIWVPHENSKKIIKKFVDYENKHNSGIKLFTYNIR